MNDATATISTQHETYADGFIRCGGLSSTLAHFVCRIVMCVYAFVLGLVSPRRPVVRVNPERNRILLTGQFLSDGWLCAHAKPIGLSAHCAQLYVVSAKPMLAMENVTYICPPKWLAKLTGQALARYLMFCWSALRQRPEVVGGFHLLCNGLLALLVGKAIRARTVYFCVGGWTEIDGGGARGENRLFGMMRTDDQCVERRLLNAVSRFDLIVTMGTRARDFLRSKSVKTQIEVVPGGIDGNQYARKGNHFEFDVIGVFRLAPVKRVDIFIRTIAEAAKSLPEIRVAIVGDGRLRAELEALCDQLGITKQVTFVGQQSNVSDWLGKSRLFLLTSDSEGVALSVMEALSAGCPVIVSDVGDLRDVVQHGVNGFLVPRRDVKQYADAILRVLGNEKEYGRLSLAAGESARAFDLNRVATRWDSILAGHESLAEAQPETTRQSHQAQHDEKQTKPNRGKRVHVPQPPAVVGGKK